MSSEEGCLHDCEGFYVNPRVGLGGDICPRVNQYIFSSVSYPNKGQINSYIPRGKNKGIALRFPPFLGDWLCPGSSVHLMRIRWKFQKLQKPLEVLFSGISVTVGWCFSSFIILTTPFFLKSFHKIWLFWPCSGLDFPLVPSVLLSSWQTSVPIVAKVPVHQIGLSSGGICFPGLGLVSI